MTAYNAFISYQSSSQKAAERLKRDLFAIAGRHAGGADFRLFLDTSDLRPGPLTKEICTALEQSRFLVVVLGPTTHESPWVAKEIEHWRDKVGAPERLFLVRADKGVDLTWDDNLAPPGFSVPDGLPKPLWDYFSVEQKWINYFGRSRDRLTGLCATLMNVETSEYLLEEAAYQRRRTRRWTAVAIVMALLFAAAAVGFVRAEINRQEAERNATQARAQADAAEALLAAADAPTLAIERALRAAGQSDSPTVRSAMLAVSHASRRLKRALVYPQEETGNPVAAARFSADGRKLLAWSAGRSVGTSHVRVWDVASGATSADVPVDGEDLRDVTWLGNGHLVACSDAGPLVVDVVAARTTRLDDAQNKACSLHPFADGVVLLSDGSAYVVDQRGKSVSVNGVTSVSAHPSSRAAVVAGPAGVTVVSAARKVPVSASPASTAFADSHGGFLIGFGAQEWGVVAQVNGEPVLKSVRVPNTAVDVAPLLHAGQMTGDLAWIADDGSISWTRDGRTTKLPPHQSQTPYATRLVPFGFEEFVAVHLNTATVLKPPTGRYGQAPDWTQGAQHQLGSARQSRTEPLVARCLDHTTVLLRGNTGAVILDAGGEQGSISGEGQFTSGCDVVDTGRSLTIVPRLSRKSPVIVRTTLVADSVAVSPVGDQLALVKAGFPIEVLSTLPVGSLPKPWDVTTTSEGGAVTALGERELFTRQKELVTASSTGVIGRVGIPEFATLASPRPDGKGGALKEVRPAGLLLADEKSTTPGADLCADQPVKYVPDKDFSRSVRAAEAQIPIARVNGKVIDCRDGSERSDVPNIVSYEIGHGIGQIVARGENRLTLTMWDRGSASGPSTVDGPVLPADQGVASFDPTGQVSVAFAVGGRHLTLYQRDGDTWNTSLTLPTGLSGVQAARLVDNASLVLAVSTEGAFELFDVATGRLVASDPGLSLNVASANVTGFSARRAGDNLSVGLHRSGSPTAEAAVQIPIAIPALKHQLCSLYRTTEC
ncbi:TIR domain-containing protein [Lentzea sp. NPDC054927]